MTPKPHFWIGFTVVAALALALAASLFPRAFPLVSLDIEMTREDALERARVLAQMNGWAPGADARSAASFSVDGAVQTFVELEGGGPEAFRRMLESTHYAPYTWRVRLFREREAAETTVRFAPGGTPISFVETLAEETPRPNLEPEAARELGERVALSDWSIDTGAYTLVESAQEERIGGRIDHTFVYESPDEALGEGSYRLRIVVRGDQVGAVEPFVRIPQSFVRRYEEMRSANEGIAAVGAAGAVMYLIGCVVGLFFLLRMRAVLWRPAVLVAGVLALAQLLAAVNALPLVWMAYDTALPAAGFLAQTLLGTAAVALALGLVVALSLIAAEGLSRLAFPHHPQLWEIWRRDAAPTPAIAGRTAAGWLCVPVMLAYAATFYLVAGRQAGWWMPSEALISPDSLAHFAPWLTPFVNALHAGVWEEALFRAVPLAGAALLGRRFGRPWLFVGVALVLQALVFGAAHANYPAQPAHARLVELILPSLLFGVIYLRYGLLPAIVLHFGYNVVLMAMPLFATTGTGVWFDRSLLVVLALLPVWVVLAQRLRAGAWSPLPAERLNGAWRAQPTLATAPVQPTRVSPAAGAAGGWPMPVLGGLCVLVAVLGGWLQSSSRPQVPTLDVTRTEAIAIARQALDERAVQLPPGSQPIARVLGQNPADRFVWETAGRDTYEALIGEWLHPPRYLVRFVRFEGDVAERAEEWVVTVTGDGDARTVRHFVPQDAEGAALSEEEARQLARAGIERELGIDTATLREVLVEPRRQPARTDWLFSFARSAGDPLPLGEQRVNVDIAGDEVTGVVQAVHIPEEWQREQRAGQITMTALSVLRPLTIVVIVIGGIVAALVAWSGGRFSVRHFLGVAGLALAAATVALANDWPARVAQFSTAQPFALQAGMLLVGAAIGLLVIAAAYGLIAGMSAGWLQAREERAAGSGSGLRIVGAVLLGLALHGATGIGFLAGAATPAWPATAPAASALPALAPVTQGITSLLGTAVVLLVLCGVLGRYSAEWTRRHGTCLVLAFALGALTFGSTAAGSVQGFAISAAAAGMLFAFGYWVLLRLDLALAAVVAVAHATFGLLPALEGPYPGAAAGALVALLGLGFLGWWWYEGLTAAAAAAPGDPEREARPTGAPHRT